MAGAAGVFRTDLPHLIKSQEVVMQYGHSTLGVYNIVGLTSEDNLDSIKLLKKLGMDFENTVKMFGDDPRTVLYSYKTNIICRRD